MPPLAAATYIGTQGASLLATDPLGPRWPPAVIRSFTSIKMVRSHTQTSYSHTTLSHTHNLLLTTLTHTQLSLTHTSSSHITHTHTQLIHTRHQRAFCVAGVALGDIDVHAWQAWRLVTSTFTLHGKRGAWRHRPAFCVACVALGDINLHFAWHTWPLWHWACSGGALGSLGASQHFAWQAWRLVTSICTLCGRRSAW